MIRLKIELPPHLYARLQHEAERRGQLPEKVAVEMLQEELDIISTRAAELDSADVPPLSELALEMGEPREDEETVETLYQKIVQFERERSVS
jgi:hypothetical protein